MKCLREKLHSQGGASILLALLMLLVCGMVAASILAAAISNAGKVRSSRVEQQKYLTLSSAVELVCGQLQKSKYEGCYEVYEWTEKRLRRDIHNNPAKDGDGNYIYDYEPCFYCEQRRGSYYDGEARDVMLQDSLLTLLPDMKKELDGVFSRQFPGEAMGYKPLGAADVSDPREYLLLVSLPDNLSGYPYAADNADPEVYEVPSVVSVKVAFRHDTHNIIITAWLGEGGMPADGADTICAELVAADAPAPGYNPGGRAARSFLPDPADPGTDVEIVAGTETVGGVEVMKGTEEYTAPMTWKLNWIRKGAD